jgi:hypothetical protein
MGTSGAYGGSGGRDWSNVRDSLDGLIAEPGSAEEQATVMSGLAGALSDWDGDTPPEHEYDPEQTAPVVQRPPFGGLVAPRAAGGGGGAGGVGGAGGGAGGGDGSGRRGTGGGRRSRARAARVGGAVLAAGFAVRGEDDGTLRALGLSLTELQNLSPLAQCSKILNALVGSGADIDENEMRAASSTALVAILIEAMTPVAAVRLFIVEYVMEIGATELGARLREDGTGEVSVQVEDGLRSFVTARVDQIELDAEHLGPQELQNAVYEALGSARDVLAAMT